MSSGNNFFEDALNVATQISTGGIAGFEDGKIAPGIVGDAAVDVTKEITGAKAAEDANKLARDQFEQAQADALADRKAAQEASAQTQLQASRSAGAFRKRTNTISSSSSDTSTDVLGGDERDFLGL